MVVRLAPTLRRFRIWEGKVDDENLAGVHPDGIDSLELPPEGGFACTVLLEWVGGRGPWYVGLTMGAEAGKSSDEGMAKVVHFDGSERTQFFHIQAPDVEGLTPGTELRYAVQAWLDGGLVETLYLTLTRRLDSRSLN